MRHGLLAAFLIAACRFAESQELPPTSAWTREVSVHTSVGDLQVLPANHTLVLLSGMVDGVMILKGDGSVTAARKLEINPPFSYAVTNERGEVLLVRPEPARDNRIGKPAILLTKLAPDLSVAWTRRYSGFDAYPHMAEGASSDGDFLLFGSQAGTALVIRIKSDGTVRWAQLYDPSGDETIEHVVPARDGGFIAAGHSQGQPWLLKLDREGAVVWQRRWLLRGRLLRVNEARDGGFVTAGSYRNGLLTGKVDRAGKDQWLKATTARHFSIEGLVPLANGNHGILANSGSVFLLAMDPEGSIAWQKELRVDAALSSKILAKANGFVVAPSTAGGSRPVLAQLGWDGSTTCSLFSNSSVTLSAVSAGDLPLTIEQRSLALVSSEEEPIGTTTIEVSTETHDCPGDKATPPASLVHVQDVFPGLVERERRAEQYRDLLSRRQYASLDQIADAMRNDKTFVDPMEWDLHHFYTSLAGFLGSLGEAPALKLVEGWISERPESPAARVLLVATLHGAAWQRRGPGFNDTVTSSGESEYTSLMRRASDELQKGRAVAEKDPHYQLLAVTLAEETGGDGRAIARAAARWTHYPRLFLTALSYLRERWGGSPDRYRAWVEEAARLTKDTYGEAMYAYLAYQSLFHVEEEERVQFRLDPARVRKGCEDMIAAGPHWRPAYHRCARLARVYNDRRAAEALFNRPELAWFAGAEGVWQLYTTHEEARMWARSDPEGDGRRWPRILLESQQTYSDGASYPQGAAFLIETPGGIKAISAVALDRPADERINTIERARQTLTSWTLSAPDLPNHKWDVASIDTQATANYQKGVALSLAATGESMAVKPLPRFTGKRHFGPVFVVACRWAKGRCRQVVLVGSERGSSGATFAIGLHETLDPASLAGGAVLNSEGMVIGVVHGASTTSGGNFPTMVDATFIDYVLQR